MNLHPHITRTRVVRPCAACEGCGEQVENHAPQPYGIPDPQCDEPTTCLHCHGRGEIVEWTDPLVALRRARLVWRMWPWTYGAIRQRATSPVCLPEAMQAPARFRCAA